MRELVHNHVLPNARGWNQGANPSSCKRCSATSRSHLVWFCYPFGVPRYPCRTQCLQRPCSSRPVSAPRDSPRGGWRWFLQWGTQADVECQKQGGRREWSTTAWPERPLHARTRDQGLERAASALDVEEPTNGQDFQWQEGPDSSRLRL